MRFLKLSLWIMLCCEVFAAHAVVRGVARAAGNAIHYTLTIPARLYHLGEEIAQEVENLRYTSRCAGKWVARHPVIFGVGAFAIGNLSRDNKTIAGACVLILALSFRKHVIYLRDHVPPEANPYVARYRVTYDNKAVRID